MEIKLVSTLEEAQIVREIRNSVSEYMTRDTSYITKEQQQKWWENISKVEYHLYLCLENAIPLGYGMLRYEDSKWLGTLAILPEHQNKGYGTDIYKFLASRIYPLWVEIYSDNIASLRAAVRAGFNIEHIGDKIIVFSTRKHKI